MVHCNNCTTDLDAWVKLFRELADAAGAKIEKAALYDELYFKALEGEEDCGGLLSYNYHAGEHITGFEQGRPLFVRSQESNFTLANFMRNLIFSTMATLKLGMDIMTEKEHIRLDNLLDHGGPFKTKGVGQRLKAGALNTPVSVMEGAGEGGAWGIALLAAFMLQGHKGKGQDALSLEKFLAEKVFANVTGARVEPDQKDVRGFKKYMERYSAGLKIERAAVENL
jgi:sugar (pentulose or hexulose) kinase